MIAIITSQFVSHRWKISMKKLLVNCFCLDITLPVSCRFYRHSRFANVNRKLVRIERWRHRRTHGLGSALISSRHIWDQNRARGLRKPTPRNTITFGAFRFQGHVIICIVTWSYEHPDLAVSTILDVICMRENFYCWNSKCDFKVNCLHPKVDFVRSCEVNHVSCPLDMVREGWPTASRPTR